MLLIHAFFGLFPSCFLTLELLDKVEAAMARYRNADLTGSSDTLTEDAIQELRGNLSTCVALGDERVSLALQTYELVRHFDLYLSCRPWHIGFTLTEPKSKRNSAACRKRRLWPFFAVFTLTLGVTLTFN